MTRFPLYSNRYPLLLLIALLALAVTGQALAMKPRTVPGQYIVELEAAPSLRFEGGAVSQLSAGGQRFNKAMAPTSPSMRNESRFDAQSAAVLAYGDHLDRERGAVLSVASSWLGRDLEPMHVYRHVMNGFSAQLTADEAAMLATLPGVKSVQPVVMHELLDDNGPQWIRADRVWSPQFGTPVPNRGEGMVLGLIDSGINWDSNYFSDTPGGFVMENPRGQFFGLCSDPEVLCNNKIIGVYDFTSEGTQGRDINGHGSHVGSSAVGAPVSFTLDFGLSAGVFFASSGVAPYASVISYKACEGGDPNDPDDGGGCPGSALVAALEQAAIDQVDVVNYSIGSTGAVAPRPWAGFGQFSSDREAFLNLRFAGVVPIAAAGNNGPADGSVSSPANSPWVVGVANATHNRVVGASLTSMTGGVGPAPFISGAGLNDDGQVRPIVYAGDFGNALCGTGTAELGASCGDNSGSTNPFPPGTFNGEIVVCDRGVYGRVEKGRNLQLAGAGGMILANTDAQGADVVAEEHCLPALHVGNEDGNELRDWLSQGSNHQARIPFSARQVNPAFGGRLNNSSGRGPGSGAPDVMKPNVTAPGTNILGASANGAGGISFSTGTSMASPHVAGAALLLRRAFPDWPVDAVISALETTAVADLVTNIDSSAARVIDGGAGGVQVDRAAEIGLYLPVTEAEFRAANPDLGGNPGSLNLPGVVSTACPGGCSFERTLRALSFSAWNVSTEGDMDITVSPTNFELQPGQEVTLTIDIAPGSVPEGAWGRGAVVLDPTLPSLETQRLTVGALFGGAQLPESINLTTTANRGRLNVELGALGSLPEAQFPASALTRPTRVDLTLPVDPSNGDPFDGSAGLDVRIVNVPDDALLLRADTNSSQAPDVDLFVGQDLNGNGQAEQDELICFSTSFNAEESCVIREPQDGPWWILVQNWNGSGALNGDAIELDYAVLSDEDDASFGVNGPGRHEPGQLEVQMFIDQPALRRNEVWWAAFGIGTSPEEPFSVGVIPVELVRTANVVMQATALFNGETRAVTLPPSDRHNGLYVDVPPGVTRLDIDVQGDDDVGGDLRFTDFADLSDAFPSTPVASGPSLDSKAGSASGFTLSENNPAPGRYFVDLNNLAAGERQVNVTVSMAETQRLEPRYGLWSPVFRGISQGIEWQLAGLGFMIWYSYDINGLPIFYIAINDVDQTSSTWSGDLIRVTGGTNNRQYVDTVGRVSLTSIARDRMMFAWRLNGAHGAEIMNPDAPESCPELNGSEISYTGHWFSPGQNQGGTTVIVYEDGQFYVRYYFDGDGVGRWAAVVSTGPGAFADDFEVWSFQGFCPNCDDSVQPDFQVVGTYERNLTGPDTGTEILDFVSRAPLNTDIRLEVPIQKLSETLSCSP
ncbi:MAG: S8 family serine peptidase [Pseudomonadota bacterium]